MPAGTSRGAAAKQAGGLSAREQELLALEGSAYVVSWSDGQPVLIQTGPRRYPLSMKDIDFLRQHARDVRDGKQPPKAAAAVPEKPKAQGSSRSPAGSQPAPASREGMLQSRDRAHAFTDCCAYSAHAALLVMVCRYVASAPWSMRMLLRDIAAMPGNQHSVPLGFVSRFTQQTDP